MITREFNLYLHAGHSIPLVINCNQYDRGEQWLFTLFNADGTQYVPSSGAIVGIKSDNLGIINSGTVDASGRVVINETQQMTAAVGKAVFELVIDDGTHGTANFVVLVEPKPGDNADLSESDISMIEEAVEAAANIKPYGSPLVASTVAGMTDHEKVYVYVGSETGYTSGHWYYYDGDSWEDGGVYNSVAVQTDTTLAISGMAADAKKTGDEISDLKSQIANGGLTAEIKQALMNCFNYVAWKDNDPNASQYISALQNALYPPANLSYISCVYTQSGTVYSNASLDDLKSDLVVTAHYDNSTTEIVTNYTLSGTLTVGTSTITVAYGGKTTSFTVNVTEYVSWDFEWYASSGEKPSAMSTRSYTFAENNEYMEVDLQTGTALNFNNVGEGEIYIVLATTGASYNNNPQVSILTATGAGAKFFLTSAGAISSNVTGSSAVAYTPVQGEYHEYGLVCKTADCKLYVDGSVVDSGTGRTGDQYMTATGLIGSTVANMKIRVKSIKFRSL